MKRYYHFFYCLIGVMTLMIADAHAITSCPAKPAGDVNVIWNSDPIKYDFTKSQNQMDRMENDTVSPYDRGQKTHVGGLMQGGVSLQSQIQVAMLKYPRSQQICQWIDRVDVRLKIQPTIYISRDHAKGTCRHNAIMEHEMKHVFIDREVVKKYVPILKRELEQAVLKVGIVGPKNARDQEKYQKKINDYISQQVKAINARLNEERRVKQQAIDNINEYERVARQCG